MTQAPPIKPVAPATDAGVLNVPPAQMPICTRVWATSPFSDPKSKLVQGEPVVWAWNSPHPFVPSFKIVRMYIIPGVAVDVFSTDGGTVGARHTLPWHSVLFIEESMDAPTFVAEMTDAEEGDDEEEEEEEEEDEDDPADPKPGALPVAPTGVALVPINGVGGQG